MAWHDLEKLQEQRNEVTTKMRGLLEVAAKEGRAMTADEQQQFDRMDSSQEEFKGSIERIQKFETIGDIQADHREANERFDFTANPRTAPTDRITERDRDLALRAHMLCNISKEGKRAVSGEMLEAAKKVGLDLSYRDIDFMLPREAPRSIGEAREQAARRLAEARATSNAQNVATAAEGGNTVPNDTMTALEVAMLAFGGMRQAARIVRTDTGASLPVPTLDDTAVSGARIAENTATTTNSLAFGQVTFSSYTYTSHLVPASVEFLQDTSINAAAVIGEALGTRIGRIQNSEFTTNNSTVSGPEGVIGASTAKASALGKTSSTYNTLIYSELVDLLHSVDPAYRSGPNVRWMFTDTTLGLMKKLVDGDSRPLWLPSIVAGQPDMILGFPYTINQDMNDFSATTGGQKTIVFGDFDRFWIREPRGVTISRLDERYAELRQVAWLGFARADSASIQYSALKHLVTGTT